MASPPAALPLSSCSARRYTSSRHEVRSRPRVCIAAGVDHDPGGRDDSALVDHHLEMAHQRLHLEEELRIARQRVDLLDVLAGELLDGGAGRPIGDDDEFALFLRVAPEHLRAQVPLDAADLLDAGLDQIALIFLAEGALDAAVPDAGDGRRLLGAQRPAGALAAMFSPRWPRPALCMYWQPSAQACATAAAPADQVSGGSGEGGIGCALARTAFCVSSQACASPAGIPASPPLSPP